jgi:hypothetical protein
MDDHVTQPPVPSPDSLPPSDDGRPVNPWMLFLLIGGPLILAAIIVVWALGPLLLDHWRQQNVLATGVAAEAQIISLTDTGTLINYQPLAIVTVEVMPQGRAPFQAVVKQTISPINATYFSPGNFVPVKYDPADPSRVAFTFGPGQTGALPPPGATAPPP